MIFFVTNKRSTFTYCNGRVSYRDNVNKEYQN